MQEGQEGIILEERIPRVMDIQAEIKWIQADLNELKDLALIEFLTVSF